MSESIESDVAIIGSGVAGALVAAELAGGLSVTVIEAGPRIDRAKAVRTYWDAAIKAPEAPYPHSETNPFPLSRAPEEWYVQEGPDLFLATYLRAVGGTTWHWLGTTLRLVPDDFRLRSTFGRGMDWPLDYAELEPWYLKAEEALGVAGEDSEDLGSPRTKGYPLPKIPMSYCERAYVEALAGTPYAAVVHTPQARNSVAFQERPPCCGSASCVPICPVQAKYDATVQLDRAEAKGARVLDSSVVVALKVDDSARIVEARIKRPDGDEVSLRAKVFVLAAHAIESPRLLLHSSSERYPKGLANRSDQVGRNLMDHPVQLSWALAEKPVWPFRGPLTTAGIDRFRSGDFRGARPAFRIEISNMGWGWPTGAPLSTARALAERGLRGAALDRALSDEVSRQTTLQTMVEQLPDPENRVRLAPDKRDFYGVPRPRISYRIDDYTRLGFAEARRAHDTMFRALGVSEINHADHPVSAYHIMGTARMGDDPEGSVVDRDLRAHDHRNLFILGSAVFPTGAAANPTLTIAALSLRAVEPIRRSLAA